MNFDKGYRLANDSNLANPTAQREVGSVGESPFPETCKRELRHQDKQKKMSIHM